MGWRYWQLNLASPARLRSISQRGVVWIPGAVQVAACADRPSRASGGRGDHVAPEPGCGCGIHATSDLASLRAEVLCLRPGLLVVGQVELWGRIVTEARPGGNGLDHRGQFASPRRLSLVRDTLIHVPPDAAVAALEAYGVAVGVSTLEQAVGPASRMVMDHLAMSAPSPECSLPGDGPVAPSD